MLPSRTGQPENRCVLPINATLFSCSSYIAALDEDDPLAQAEIAEYCLDHIGKTLAGRYRHLATDEQVKDAVTDGFMRYRANPSKFDPERGTLSAYLYVLAKSELFRQLGDERPQLLEGVRETEAYTMLVGCTEQPLEAQRRTVKMEKDRIMKALSRAGIFRRGKRDG